MDQTALVSSAEGQLKSFGSFLENYDKNLCRILKETRGTDCDNISLDRKEWLVKVDYSTDQESLPLLKLLESDRVINKTVLTFGYLCQEVSELEARAHEMQKHFLYIDDDLSTVAIDGDAKSESRTGNYNETLLLKMSNSLELLCDMQFIMQRCTILANNLLHQFGAFMAEEGHKVVVKLFDAINFFADLLVIILTFDEVLANSNFGRAWALYQKTIDAISRNPSHRKNYSTSEINGLLCCLKELDFIFSGSLFQNFLDGTFVLKDKIGSKGMGFLAQQFNDYMKHHLSLMDRLNHSDLNDFRETRHFIRLNAFCAVFHDFCGQVDPRAVKSLLELNAKHCGITLVGNVAWRADAFLRKHAETLIKSHEKLLQEAERRRQSYVNVRLATLQKDYKNYYSQVCLWFLAMRRSLQDGVSSLKMKQCKELVALFLQGLRCAGQISFLVKSLVNAHVSLERPMSKATLLTAWRLVEMLKSIQDTFKKHSESASKIAHCFLQYLQYKVMQIISMAKKKVIASTMSDRNVDALAGFKIVEKCMNGPATKTRLLTSRLALNFINYNSRILPSDQYERILATIERMQLLATMQANVRQVCDTSFLYWHQTIMSVYLKQVVEKGIGANSLQFVVESMNDCYKELERMKAPDLKLLHAVQRSNYDSVRNEVVSNLCAQIETFLRLEVHSDLQLDKQNPFEHSLRDYRDLTSAPPIEINGKYLILKDHVENYLSNMFYNLTAITLHDWKTYEEMRQMASKRLLLNPTQCYLPHQTLEQGNDILEMMRNIHIFVSQYAYNMNAQTFIERQSANKYLKTVTIEHMANSLRTHGMGIINTTVNFTYQFLRQKFYVFSQFLYDEQIRSRLMQELRVLYERKDRKSLPPYPYERADAFNKDIRRLGLTDDGQTYMDLFRKVITQIGNAMGYIRLVRSSSAHVSYKASLHLPTLDEDLQFVKKCREGAFSETTVAAAENLEFVIKNILGSFTDGTNYFKILIDAFIPFFNNPHNEHLNVFYLIVPALTINYVDYLLDEIEKINKNDEHGTIFCDEGFAMGLAYILRLLDQYNDFNFLQWFDTVHARFDNEIQKMREMQGDAQKTRKGTTHKQNNYEKLEQTLALTERRVLTYQKNFRLLFFHLHSAKIFFMQ